MKSKKGLNCTGAKWYQGVLDTPVLNNWNTDVDERMEEGTRVEWISDLREAALFTPWIWVTFDEDAFNITVARRYDEATIFHKLLKFFYN